MKRYYEVHSTTDNGGKEHLIIDVTKISFLIHNENEGLYGRTSICFGLSQYNFTGANNKILYDEIRKIMIQLEKGE